MRILFIGILLISVVVLEFIIPDSGNSSLPSKELAITFIIFVSLVIAFRLLLSTIGITRIYKFKYAVLFCIITCLILGVLIPNLVINFHPNPYDDGWQYSNIIQFMGIYLEFNQIFGSVLISIPVYYFVELVRSIVVHVTNRLSI